MVTISGKSKHNADLVILTTDRKWSGISRDGIKLFAIKRWGCQESRERRPFRDLCRSQWCARQPEAASRRHRERGGLDHLVRPLQEGNTSSSQHWEGGRRRLALQGTALSPTRTEEHACQWAHAATRTVAHARTYTHTLWMSAHKQREWLKLMWEERNGLSWRQVMWH